MSSASFFRNIVFFLSFIMPTAAFSSITAASTQTGTVYSTVLEKIPGTKEVVRSTYSSADATAACLTTSIDQTSIAADSNIAGTQKTTVTTTDIQDLIATTQNQSDSISTTQANAVAQTLTTQSTEQAASSQLQSYSDVVNYIKERDSSLQSTATAGSTATSTQTISTYDNVISYINQRDAAVADTSSTSSTDTQGSSTGTSQINTYQDVVSYINDRDTKLATSATLNTYIEDIAFNTGEGTERHPYLLPVSIDSAYQWGTYDLMLIKKVFGYSTSDIASLCRVRFDVALETVSAIGLHYPVYAGQSVTLRFAELPTGVRLIPRAECPKPTWPLAEVGATIRVTSSTYILPMVSFPRCGILGVPTGMNVKFSGDGAASRTLY